MACRGSAAALGLAALLTGCRIQVQFIERGERLGDEQYDAVVIGESDRAALLELLGPPDEVEYTLEDEVLEYHYAAHRGTNLDFLIPLSLIPSIGRFSPLTGPIRAITPDSEQPEEFEDRNRVTETTEGTITGLAGLVPAASGGDSLALQGRRLRTDVLRFTLDRRSLIVHGKEIIREVPGRENLARSAFLRAEVPPGEEPDR